MGICFSGDPEIIIPDPTPNENCVVLFKKQGMFARDQYVYKNCDKEQKWLSLDKVGKFWESPKYFLENFVKSEGSKKGQVLCAAHLKITELKKYDKDHDVDSDSDFSDSSDIEGEIVDVNVEKIKLKWAQTIEVRFYSDRDMSDEIAHVKVKAKGKAKKVTTTVRSIVDELNDEGEKVGEHEKVTVDVETKKKIKKLKYTIAEMKGYEDVPSIDFQGKPNKSEHKLSWGGPVFQAEIGANKWGSTEIKVATAFDNPALGMLMGYIVAKEISPNDIKDFVHIFDHE